MVNEKLKKNGAIEKFTENVKWETKIYTGNVRIQFGSLTKNVKTQPENLTKNVKTIVLKF